jgi:5'-nucleotidase/UDP-sugar diphosphatase
MIAPYKAKNDATMKEIVGETTALFEFGDRLSRKKEIALGDMVTTARCGTPHSARQGSGLRDHERRKHPHRTSRRQNTREQITTVPPSTTGNSSPN